MVDFTPTINPTNDPTYSGLSQATEKPQVNSSLGTLFQNVSSLGDSTVKAANTIIKDSAQDVLRTGIESIQADFGVDQATKLAEAGVPPTNVKGDSGGIASILNPDGVQTTNVSGGKNAKGAPAGVAKLGESLQDLTEQYNSGKASQSYYLGRMNALVKQVAAQYPGYKEDVIQMATSMLGVNPANALRKSLLDDLDANARAQQSAGTKEQAWVLSKIDELGAEGPAIYNSYRTGTLSFDGFVNLYAQRKGVKNDIELARARLGLKTDLDSVEKMQIGQKFEGLMGSLVMNDIHTSMETSMGNLSLADMQGRIRDQAKKPMSAGEAETMKQASSSLIVGKRAQLQMEAYKIDPATGKSFAQVMGGEAVNKSIDNALRPYTEVFDALSNDKRGIQGHWAAINKSMTDQRTHDIIKADTTEALANAQVVRNLYGDAGVNYVLAGQNGAFAPHVTALTGAMTYKMSAGKVTSLAAEVKAGQANPALTANEKQQLTFGQIENSVKLLIAPEAKPGEIASAAKAMFSDTNRGFINMFSGGTQPKVFARMAGADVQKRVQETGDPEIIGNYQKWSMNTFKALYQRGVQDLQQAGVENERFDIKYNDAAHRYEALVRPEYRDRYPNGVPRSIQGPVDRINSGLSTITPIMKMTGQDPRPLIRDTLAVMGYRPEAAPKGAPRPRTELFKPNYDDSYLKLPGDE